MNRKIAIIIEDGSFINQINAINQSLTTLGYNIDIVCPKKKTQVKTLSTNSNNDVINSKNKSIITMNTTKNISDVFDYDCVIIVGILDISLLINNDLSLLIEHMQNNGKLIAVCSNVAIMLLIFGFITPQENNQATYNLSMDKHTENAFKNFFIMFDYNNVHNKKYQKLFYSKSNVSITYDNIISFNGKSAHMVDLITKIDENLNNKLTDSLLPQISDMINKNMMDNNYVEKSPLSLSPKKDRDQDRSLTKFDDINNSFNDKNKRKEFIKKDDKSAIKIDLDDDNSPNLSPILELTEQRDKDRQNNNEIDDKAMYSQVSLNDKQNNNSNDKKRNDYQKNDQQRNNHQRNEQQRNEQQKKKNKNKNKNKLHKDHPQASNNATGGYKKISKKKIKKNIMNIKFRRQTIKNKSIKNKSIKNKSIKNKSIKNKSKKHIKNKRGGNQEDLIVLEAPNTAQISYNDTPSNQYIELSRIRMQAQSDSQYDTTPIEPIKPDDSIITTCKDYAGTNSSCAVAQQQNMDNEFNIRQSQTSGKRIEAI